MTKEEIEIARALIERAHVSRLTRSANFLESLAKKPDLAAYNLNQTKRLWLFSLLHRYRRTLADVHDLHCPTCKGQESQPKAVQLALF